MSRWDSRTVPASARRAGRAAAGVVVSVAVSWACALMLVPAFPAVTAASNAPRGHIRTGCDDCSAAAKTLPGRADGVKKTVINRVRTVADGGVPPGCRRLGVRTGIRGREPRTVRQK
jgi:hypothetical protein